MLRTAYPQQSGAVTPSVDQLRKRYLAALTLIAILTIASQFATHFMIADMLHDTHVVNIAGRQRMLSQKIAKLNYYVTTATTTDTASRYSLQLEDALSLWQLVEAGLLRGNSEMGLPGHNSKQALELYRGVQPHYEAIVAAEKVILSPTTSAAQRAQSMLDVRDHEASYLSGMNNIVFQYDLEAQEKVETAQRIESGLMGITLLVLILDAFFIFTPVIHRRREPPPLVNGEQDLKRH